jgi:hypothetical protein
MQFLQGINGDFASILHAQTSGLAAGQRREIGNILLKAAARMAKESFTARLSSTTLIINWISLFLIMSTICGRPSATLLTRVTGTPASSIAFAVPRWQTA